MNIITIAHNATMQAEESECFIIADDVHYSGYMYISLISILSYLCHCLTCPMPASMENASDTPCCRVERCTTAEISDIFTGLHIRICDAIPFLTYEQDEPAPYSEHIRSSSLLKT